MTTHIGSKQFQLTSEELVERKKLCEDLRKKQAIAKSAEIALRTFDQGLRSKYGLPAHTPLDVSGLAQLQESFEKQAKKDFDEAMAAATPEERAKYEAYLEAQKGKGK